LFQVTSRKQGWLFVVYFTWIMWQEKEHA
jgi:hypothetical protein